MAYYNRKPQLINTLYSIALSSYKNIEVIIVDDASDSEHRIEDLTSTFPFIQIIRVEPLQKTWINPCIPFNLGIKQSRGSKIIIQNPEVIHYGDVISYVHAQVRQNTYTVFSCYSLDEAHTNTILNSQTNIIKMIDKVCTPFVKRKSRNRLGWFSHPTYRPRPYHFLSAMCMGDMRQLGGFDERFANGAGYDDDEFLKRATEKNRLNFITYPLGVHQWHPGQLDMRKTGINKQIYTQIYGETPNRPQKTTEFSLRRKITKITKHQVSRIKNRKRTIRK